MSSYWVISTMNLKRNFLNTYHLKNIVKQNTCFKNPDRPTCIYLILTNTSRKFQDTCTVETRLSDFHNWLSLSLKYTFLNNNPIFKPHETINDRVNLLHRTKNNYFNFNISSITDNKFWETVKPFKRQFHRMVKHTQTIAHELLEGV